MPTSAQASFACGMGNPWTHSVIQHPPRCEHCFCVEDGETVNGVPHLKCCKCHTRMAEKFVRAWFELLAPRAVPRQPE